MQSYEDIKRNSKIDSAILSIENEELNLGREVYIKIGSI
jgi:hypothetical protein